MLGNVCLHRLPVPWTIALGVGAAVESTVVFLLLVCGLGYRTGFALLAVTAAALYWRLGRAAPRLTDPAKARTDRVSAYVAGAALACYGALYLINALAPELEPDARAYHLGLTAEYVRLAGFPARVGFYEMLPQGFEMLFVPAFAFGQHVAARLVHCAFLMASVPLILGVGRRLELPDGAGLAAAALYFCAPVAGITGTSGYTDAGGVFFTLATFYLLLVWRDTRDVRYLAPAGIMAGFCYAIKFPGALVAILAVLFVVIVERDIRVRHLLLLAGTALAMAAPWMVRAAAMTGDPVAPLFNRLFPNPLFPCIDGERTGGVAELSVGRAALAGSLRTDHRRDVRRHAGAGILRAPAGLVGVGEAGGPHLLDGRHAADSAVVLEYGYAFPDAGVTVSGPGFGIALAMALPRPALWACVAVQAVLSWPQVFALYHPGYTWRLERIPWRAALRIQSDRDYLESILPAYRVARLIEDHTEPGARIFSLISVPTAYTDREVLEYWHSAQADRLSDALRAAAQNETLCDVGADWTPRELSGLRIRIPRASPVEWAISEITLLSGEQAVVNSPAWQLDAWPEAWDVPLAFDGNLATRWRTREPVRAGMYVEADFDRPLALSGLLMTTPVGAGSITFEFYGLQRASWQLLTSHTLVTQKPPQDLRMAATRAFRSAGFRYILADYGNQGNALLGAAMRGHEAEWGLEKPVEVGPLLLFRIK